MKKLYSLILLTVLIFTLLSCGANPSPTEVTDKFLSAIKSQDGSISSYYSGEVDNDNSLLDLPDSFDDATDSLLAEKFTSFEYEISNEVIDDNKATVDVTITTYNIGEAYAQAISEYIQNAFSMVFSGASDEEIEQLMNDALIKNITDASFDYTTTVTVSLTNDEESGWMVDDFETNTALLNSISGGLIEKLSDIASSFNE